MHPAAFAFVAQTVAQYPVRPGARVLEIGARDINGSIRAVFACVGVRYLGTDIAPGPGVDVVADGATFRLPDTLADVVVCCEVLEHAPNAAEIVANAARLLCPGGRVILTAAGRGDGWDRTPHSAVDGGTVREGEHYANVSEADLRAWLEAAGFIGIEVSSHATAKDVYATAIRGIWD